MTFAVVLVMVLVLGGIYVLYPLLGAGPTTPDANLIVDIPEEPTPAWTQDFLRDPNAESSRLDVIDAGDGRTLVGAVNRYGAEYALEVTMLRMEDGTTQWTDVLQGEDLVNTNLFGGTNSSYVGALAMLRNDRDMNRLSYEVVVWLRESGVSESIAVDAEYVDASIVDDQVLIVSQEQLGDGSFTVQLYSAEDLGAGPLWETQGSTTDYISGVCVNHGIVLTGENVYSLEVGCSGFGSVTTLDLATGDPLPLARLVSSTERLLVTPYAVFLASETNSELIRIDAQAMEVWGQPFPLTQAIRDLYIDSDRVYAIEGGEVAAIDGNTGEVLWRTGPEDVLAVWGELEESIVVQSESRIVWLDAATGEVSHTLRANPGYYGGPIARSARQLFLVDGDESEISTVTADGLFGWSWAWGPELRPMVVGEHLAVVDDEAFTFSVLR